MLEAIDQDLWVIDHDFKLIGVPIGTRTTVIRLANGDLFVHSPGPLTPGLQAAIEEHGPVRHLVAPNKFHYLYFEENAKAFPDAVTYCAPGLAEKAKFSFDEELGVEAPAAWQGELEQLPIPGAPELNEVVFCHRASRTLLLTDLCFNVRESNSFLLRLMLRVNGVYGRFGPSRLAKSFMKDKSAVRAATDRLLEWDFDRVIVTHGEVLATGGHQALQDAYAAIG